MTIKASGLKQLEGQRVCVALVDGSRIDDCTLVSAGRGGAASIWVFTNGEDLFLRHRDVVELWTRAGAERCWAA